MEERIDYLLRQYSQNNCTKEELDELFAWIDKEPSDERLVAFLQKSYREFSHSNASQTAIDENGRLQKSTLGYGQDPKLGSSEKDKRPGGYYYAAACFLIFCVAGIVIWKKEPNKDNVPENQSFVSTYTAIGENKHITLTDGSQIWLNANSTLEYPDYFVKGERVVKLSGEAYFDVQNAAQSPFIVDCDKVKVRVLGTAFNIKAYSGQDVKVAVKTGKVQLVYDNRLVRILERGQGILIRKETKTLATQDLPQHKISEIGDWQQGVYHYEDTPLREVLDDLERTYGCQIYLQSPGISADAITISFNRKDGLQEALKLIANLIDMHIEQSGDNQYIIH